MYATLDSVRIARLVLATLLLSHPLHASAEKSNRLEKAKSLFQQRCRLAGENVTRTVKDVDGIFLLKLRPDALNYGNQFRLDDPYGSDYRGDGYIESFLRAHHELPGHIARSKGRVVRLREQTGYAFVEANDPKDGKRYRYTASIDQPGKTDPRYVMDFFRVVVTSSPASGPAPRYGITYEDISTAEDREYWIAGSSLKVIDLLRNEVIAERIGYMMDPGQGADGGGRSPWLMAAAHACPAFGGRRAFSAQGGQTVRFVEKVLRPRPKNQ